MQEHKWTAKVEASGRPKKRGEIDVPLVASVAASGRKVEEPPEE